MKKNYCAKTLRDGNGNVERCKNESGKYLYCEPCESGQTSHVEPMNKEE